jgi:hypothetical protein
MLLIGNTKSTSSSVEQARWNRRERLAGSLTARPTKVAHKIDPLCHLGTHECLDCLDFFIALG